jgi:hypothetical protein
MRLVSGLSPWRPKLNPRPIHLRYLVKNVKLGQVFLWEPRCFFSSIIPPVFHTYSMSLLKLYNLSTLQLRSVTHINISVWRRTLYSEVFHSLFPVLLACIGIVLRSGLCLTRSLCTSGYNISSCYIRHYDEYHTHKYLHFVHRMYSFFLEVLKNGKCVFLNNVSHVCFGDERVVFCLGPFA